MAALVVSTNNEDIELKVTGVKTTVVENVELTLFPQRYPVERSYTGRFEGRQKCQERDTARSRSYASSGKSRLPSPVARASAWENGYNESFNGKLRDELLNREIFYSLKEVQILTERRRREYNTVRPPVPEAIMPELQLVANPR